MQLAGTLPSTAAAPGPDSTYRQDASTAGASFRRWRFDRHDMADSCGVTVVSRPHPCRPYSKYGGKLTLMAFSPSACDAALNYACTMAITRQDLESDRLRAS